MSEKCLSVIIPVRNQSVTLDELLGTLTGLPAPEGWDVEIICVDNNSDDGITPGIIASHDVTGLCEKRLGPSHARNTGARASRGELLFFIDADANVVHEDMFTRIVDKAEELGEFAFFGGPILLPPKQMNNPIAFADHMACWSGWAANRYEGESVFQPTACIIQRKWFEKVGGFRSDIRVLEDWDLQTRLCEAPDEGAEPPKLSGWFFNSVPVYHSARSSLFRTLKHSWYWGLPSRDAWLQPRPGHFEHLTTPVRRWLYLPLLFRMRMHDPLRCGWRVSKVRAILSLPFLALTVLVWTVAVIVGKGQPGDDQYAPV